MPGQAHNLGETAKDARLFVETILRRRRYEVRWRYLTARFGPWHRVLVRFFRWKHRGVRTKALTALQDETGLDQLLLDSAPVGTHQHADGALKKRPASARAQLRRLLAWAIPK